MTNQKVVGAECPALFLDDMCFIQDNVDEVFSEFLYSPENVKATIIEEKLGADHDEIVVTFCNMLFA